MPATPSPELFDEGRCYACFGSVSEAQILELALLRRILISANPSADATPQALMDYGKCYACVGVSSFEILKLALLDQISQAA